jgi:hypothetical protein
MNTKFPHVFMLFSFYRGNSVLVLPDAGFIFPKMSSDEQQDYVNRWGAEGLWVEGWLNCALAVNRLVDDGALPPVPSRRFFRMMFDQRWPLQYHALKALAAKSAATAGDLAPELWTEIERFCGMLGPGFYRNAFEILREADRVAKANRRASDLLLREAVNIY